MLDSAKAGRRQAARPWRRKYGARGPPASRNRTPQNDCGACRCRRDGARRAPQALVPQRMRLLQDDDPAAILRPGRLVGTEDRRPLLAVADRLDAVRVDAERDQVVLDRGRATLA